MGIITKEVKVKPTGKMIQYYNNKGYNAEHKKPLVIKVDDLPDESCIAIDVLCDYCEDMICHPTYRDYRKRIEKFGNYACDKCGIIHKKESCIRLYGVDNASKIEEVKERTRFTNIERYGVPYTQQSPDVRAKANETLCKNGSQKTSKQQLYLHNLYGGELNFFIKYYATDICFPEEKLVVEYDGGGHDLRVTLGRLTQEEFDQKEIIRNNIIKREGYKQMRIISSNDKLPSDTTLLQMLSDARTYFSQYPNHSWIEFNISTSTVRNAENINGIPYDFGALRTIKDNDIQNQSDIEQQTNKKGA